MIFRALAVFALPFTLTVAAPTTVIQQGQALMLVTPMDWAGTNTLYALHSSFLRDSAGIKVAANPCATVVPVMNSSSVGPESQCTFTYNIRSRDSSQASLIFKWSSRDTGYAVDTTWIQQGYLWDTVSVVSTQTTSLTVAPAGNAFRRYARLFNLVAGGEYRMCTYATNVGSGDTVVIQNPALRCR